MRAYDRLILSRRPVLYWPLWESAGEPRDLAGPGADVTTLTSVDRRNVQAPGDRHGMAWLGGGGASRNRVLTQTDNWTMEAWVRPDSIGANAQELFANHTVGSNGWVLLVDTARNVQAVAQGVGFLADSTNLLLPAPLWSHVVLMRRSGTWLYWINGKRDPTDGGGTGPNTPGAGAVTEFPTSPANFSRGIAGFAVYDRALNPDEVVENYKAGLQGIWDDPIFTADFADTVQPPFATIGATGFEPDVEGPEELDAPFATIGFQPFAPAAGGSISPPFFTIGVKPKSVFVLEDALPPFVPPSLPPTLGGGAGGGSVPIGPGVPLPPLSSGGLAGIRFYQGPPWRWVVTDPLTATVTFLDRLAFEAQVQYILNRAATAKLSVPSDNPEVNILHAWEPPPGPTEFIAPFVNEGDRKLYGFRREGTSESAKKWIIRYAGTILQTEDTGLTENARTIVTAADGWQLLYGRPMVDIDGGFPDTAGFFSFNDTQVGTIALTFLRNTVANHGTVGIDMPATFDFGDGPEAVPGATGFWGGTIENTTQIDTNFQQGMSVGEIWEQLVQTGLLDIVLTPVYDPILRPGITHDLSIYQRVGSQAADAVMAWDKPSRNLVRFNHVKDGLKRANTVRYYEQQGGPPVGGGIPISDGTSILRYGEYWAQQFFPGRVEAAALAFAELQLLLRANGVDTVEIEPTMERAPFLFTEWFLGDTVPVFASNRARQAVSGYQRIYGIQLNIDENAYEKVARVLGSPEEA